MPSFLSHPAVPLAMVFAAGTRRVPLRLLGAGVLFAVLPDADVIGYYLGIAYDHVLGHRGFFHSPFFALVCSLIGALSHRALGSTYRTAFVVLFLSMLLHGVLDAFTNGGLGIAFLSPFSNQRFFFAWQPILVSPLGLERMFTARGSMVLKSELMWVWMPLMGIGWIDDAMLMACYQLFPDSKMIKDKIAFHSWSYRFRFSHSRGQRAR